MKINRSYRKSTIPEHAKCVFEGVIFDVYQWEQELFDGSKTTFEKLARPDTAIIYPVLEDGRILLIEDSQPGQPTYLCPPMGRVDVGSETPEAAAARELLEETGYRATLLVPLYDIEPYIKFDWRIYAFVGRGAVHVAEQHTDAGERIALHPVTFDELFERALRPDFDDLHFRVLALEAQIDPAKKEALRKTFYGA